MAPRAGDGETFVVQQALNREDSIQILAAIQPVPLRTLDWLEHREFRLPVAQHKRLRGSQPARFADPEQALGRNDSLGMSIPLDCFHRLSPSLYSGPNPNPFLAGVNVRCDPL